MIDDSYIEENKYSIILDQDQQDQTLQYFTPAKLKTVAIPQSAKQASGQKFTFKESEMDVTMHNKKLRNDSIRSYKQPVSKKFFSLIEFYFYPEFGR